MVSARSGLISESSKAEHTVNLGSFLKGDLHAEGFAEPADDALQFIFSIADSNGATLGVEAHGLAPHVLHDVVGEQGADGVGRSWQEPQHVGHVCRSEIGLDGFFVLSRNSHSDAKGKDGDEHPQSELSLFLFYYLSIGSIKIYISIGHTLAAGQAVGIQFEDANLGSREADGLPDWVVDNV